MALPGEPILSPPTPPDFLLCSNLYAERLSTLDCLLAADNGLPRGTASVAWVTNPLVRTDYRLPYQVVHELKPPGDCSVRVQAAGPFPSPRDTPNVMAVPEEIRSLAARVIQQCVTLSGGIGGFGTLGISNLIDYVSNGWVPNDFARLASINNSHYQRFPLSFLTVTLSRKNDRAKYPGNTDPAVPQRLSDAASGLISARGRNPSRLWEMQARSMRRGGPRAWYNAQSTFKSEMSYECNSALGAPSSKDCDQILSTKLGSSFSSTSNNMPLSDTLTVSSGTTTFLHSNTCYLAISAAASLVLTWAQIATAVSTLMDVCVDEGHPTATVPKGGKAFYSAPQPITSSRKKRRKRQNGDDDGDDLVSAMDHTNLTGLNALPPSVNVTIFEQREAWVESCTWRAVERGGSVSACP